MPTDLKKLQRRPFLMPLLLPIISIVVMIAAGTWLLDARATTLVIVARHAEVDVGKAIDADLSLNGKERAARLAKMLAQRTSSVRPIDAVFALDTRKSQQTAAPLAEALSLPVSVLPNATASDLAKRIRSEYRGDTVLIVASNNVIPQLVEDLLGTTIVVDDKDFDRLEVIVLPRLSRGRLLELRY
jgi:broad specificity phosphatase PhoE